MVYLYRLNKTFKAKLLLFHALLWSFLFAGTGVIVYQIVYHRLETKMGEQLLAMTRLVGQQLESKVSAQLQPGFFDTPDSFFLKLTSQLRGFLQAGVLDNIILLNSQGTVLLDATGESIPGFKPPWLKGKNNILSKAALKPVILPIQKEDFGLLHQTVLLPLESGVILEVDADPHYLDILREFTNVSIMLGLVGLCVSGMAGAFVAQRVIQPMNLVFKMTEDVLMGRFPQPDVPLRSDELGRWAQLLQSMFGRIHHRETELSLLRQTAENQAVEMKLVAAGIAHEVRNPLGVIQGQVDRIQKKAKDLGPELQASAQKIQGQVQALDILVSKFLAYSRAFNLERQPFPLPELLARVAQDLSDKAQKQKVEILRDFGPCEPLRADWNLLYSSFYNLALNALQVMPDGGKLIFRLRQILNRALIEVEDSGPGIAPANLPKLFTPFFSTKSEGTGLGLAFTQKVFRAHGGQIEALNRPEGGAVFRIILPLQEVAA
ncbi:MAG TPA: HAMP domain-containing sensor histidine kinase [bacterium]|nr:HAMP domain-containing sensor histidine kinase [bacterium]